MSWIDVGICALWLLLAALLKLPISGTHTVVDLTLGFILVSREIQRIQCLTRITLGVNTIIYCHNHLNSHKNRQNTYFLRVTCFPIGKMIGTWFISPVMVRLVL